MADMVLSGECDLVNASRLERRPATMPWPNYFANWLFAVTGSHAGGREVHRPAFGHARLQRGK